MPTFGETVAADLSKSKGGFKVRNLQSYRLNPDSLISSNIKMDNRVNDLLFFNMCNFVPQKE